MVSLHLRHGTQSGPWLAPGTLPFTMVVPWQCPPDMHVLPTSQACPWGQSRRSYETVLSKYKPREPAGWGGGDCLRSLVSPPLSTKPCLPDCSCCLWAGSKRILLLSQMETRARVVLLWDPPKLLWLFLTLTVLGFWTSDTRQNTCPTHSGPFEIEAAGTPAKTQIHPQSNSKEIENYVIKEMIVFKHITFWLRC